ncbi:MAG: ATP-binding protein [Oscillospiraceae bacterium]|nr:ATP-binding protein [Oscillospiraceae bacterium]
MKISMFSNKLFDKEELHLKNRFVAFSIILFSIILVLGSAAFILSMQQIIRVSKGVELSQLLSTERLRLESAVEGKISMVLKMAKSPIIIRHFSDPEHSLFRVLALDEIDSFRSFFSEGYEISWVNDIDRIVYSTIRNDTYVLDADSPANYWYYATLYETEEYSFNVNYNPITQAFKLWINAPVIDNEGKPVGMVAVGLEIYTFIDIVYMNTDDEVDLFIFNSAGEITGARDAEIVMHNAHIMDEMSELGIDIDIYAKALKPGETHVFNVRQGTVVIGTVPLLEWYTIAFKHDSISDYNTPMTTLFLVVLIAISLIFIIFNIFIARTSKYLRTTMDSLIDARSEADNQLLELNLMVRATKIGLWNMNFTFADTDDPIESVTWSDEFRKLLGYTDTTDFPDIFNNWLDCVHPDDEDRVLESFDRHLKDTSGKTPFDVEYRMKKKNGEWGYYRDTGETIRDENGKPLHVAGALLDITETRNLINEIEYQRLEAENANNAKSAFLSRMSHEIRTPMNAVLGITEIQLYKETLDADTREALEKVYVSGEMLLGIINDILDLSKIEAGKLEIQKYRYDIASLVSDTAQLNMMRIGSKRVNFELNINEHMLAQLSGDELRIKQIFNNLLSNAFKYTDTGTVSLTINTVETEENSGKIMLVVTVSDTGQGMTEEQVSKLFDEYSRFNLEANSATEGTGLGMNITRNLIDLMGGRITVHSEPGVGSTFTVYLPQDFVSDDELGPDVVENLQQFRAFSRAQMSKIKITREPMPYGRILIVDDVETNIYVTKGLLTPYRLTMESAESGFAAINIIKSGEVYDIILMDHMMPQMDGVEATKILRDMGYKEPIVALTANAVSGQADMFLENGFDDFVSKPIDLRQMNLVLNKFIRDKQPPEVIEAARQEAAAENSNEQGSSGQQGDEQAGQSVLSSEVAGLDIAKGLERYHGDEKTYLKILSSYAKSVRAMLEAVETVTEDEIADYKIKVHGIKGASYDIFADEIGKEAELLEHAAVDKNLDLILERNPAFLEATGRFIDDIDDVLSLFVEDDTSKPKLAKPNSDLLSKLLEACKVYDMGIAEEVMAEIDKYQYTADNGLAVWLRENVDMMNFKEVEERLS